MAVHCVKHKALRIEFEERGRTRVKSFIWVSNASTIQNKTAYIKLIENTINAQLPDPFNDPELIKLVQASQVRHQSRTCWKYSKNECCFSYGFFFFTKKTIIAKPLDSELRKTMKSKRF